jgi:protein-L-isoaspartate(D-aspartate) O-methyltransferase
MKKNNLFFRMIGFFVLTFFTGTTISPSLRNKTGIIYAETLQGRILPRHGMNLVNPMEIVGSLKLPEELGTIQETYLPTAFSNSANRLVIYLQDAHANYDSATNIHKMIQLLQENYGVPLVFLEGGEGKLDSLFFQSFPDNKLKARVLEGYLKRGELSGSEVASILREDETEYYGIETQSLYHQNKQALLESIKKEKEILDLLSRLESELEERGAKYFSKMTKLFHAKQKKFRKEFLNLEAYVKFLKDLFHDTSKKKGAAPRPIQRPAAFSGLFPELNKILAVTAAEKRLGSKDFDRAVIRWIQHFQAKVLPQLSKEKQMEIGGMIQKYRIGELSPGLLVKRMEELLPTPSLVPEILKRTVYHVRTLSSIQGTKLFEELETLEDKLRTALPQTPEERVLLEDFYHLELLKRLAKLELTKREWQQLQKTTTGGGLVAGYLGFFQAERVFYELAAKRDDALFQNMMQIMERKKAKVAVMVTGGFHTQGITRNLKESGIAFVLISPRIHQLGDKSNYFNVMQGKMSYMHYFRGSLWDALAQDYAARLGTLLHGREAGAVLKHWRDRIIQRSMAIGRITEAGSYTRYVDALFRTLASRPNPERNPEAAGNERVVEDLRQRLEHELDFFFSIYVKKMKAVVNQKLEILRLGLKEMWQAGEVTPHAVRRLFDRMDHVSTTTLAPVLPLAEVPLTAPRSEMRVNDLEKWRKWWLASVKRKTGEPLEKKLWKIYLKLRKNQKVQLRLYPDDFPNRIHGVFEVEGEFPVVVRASAANFERSFKKPDELGDPFWDSAWLEQHFSFKKIQEILKGEAPLRRVYLTRLISEEFIRKLKIDKNQEGKLVKLSEALATSPRDFWQNPRNLGVFLERKLGKTFLDSPKRTKEELIDNLLLIWQVEEVRSALVESWANLTSAADLVNQKGGVYVVRADQQGGYNRIDSKRIANHADEAFVGKLVGLLSFWQSVHHFNSRTLEDIRNEIRKKRATYPDWPDRFPKPGERHVLQKLLSYRGKDREILYIQSQFKAANIAEIRSLLKDETIAVLDDPTFIRFLFRLLLPEGIGKEYGSYNAAEFARLVTKLGRPLDTVLAKDWEMEIEQSRRVTPSVSYEQPRQILFDEVGHTRSEVRTQGEQDSSGIETRGEPIKFGNLWDHLVLGSAFAAAYGIGVSLDLLPFSMLGFIPFLAWYVSRRVKEQGQQKKVEKALRESGELHRTLLESLPQKIFVKDRQSRFLLVNEPFARDYGMTPQEMVGKSDEDIVPKELEGKEELAAQYKELAKKYMADDQEVMKSRRPHVIEEINVSGGQEKIARVVKAPILNKMGDVNGLIGIWEDITAQKQAEKELLSLERRYAAEQITLSLAHEIANPASNITLLLYTFADRLDQEEGIPREALRDLFIILEHEIGRISDNTARMLGFRKLQGRDKIPVFIENVILDTLKFVGASLQDAGIVVKRELGKERSVVIGARNRLTEAFLNLITNAKNAMKDTDLKELTIKVERAMNGDRKPVVKVSFQDTGRGMSKEKLKRIGEPGFTDMPDKKGTGMGLANVFEVVQEHHGKIGVLSEVGVGSTFVVELPLVVQETAFLRDKALSIQRFIYDGLLHDANNLLSGIIGYADMALGSAEKESTKELLKEFLKHADSLAAMVKKHQAPEIPLPAIDQAVADMLSITKVMEKILIQLFQKQKEPIDDEIQTIFTALRKKLEAVRSTNLSGSFQEEAKPVSVISSLQEIMNLFEVSKKLFPAFGIADAQLEIPRAAREKDITILVDKPALFMTFFNILSLGMDHGMASEVPLKPQKKGLRVKVDLNERERELIISFNNNYFWFTNDELKVTDLGLGEEAPAVLRWQEEKSNDLALSHRVLMHFAGRIAVQNQQDGSVVRIFIPYIKRDSEPGIRRIETKEWVKEETFTPVPEVIQEGAPKILVADDEKIQRDLLPRILKGYNVWKARHGQEAYALIKEAKESGEPFDLAILDVTMPLPPGVESPIKNGLILTKKLREEGFSPQILPIIFSTGHAVYEQEKEELRGLINGLMSKVSSPEEKLALIKSVLAQTSFGRKGGGSARSEVRGHQPAGSEGEEFRKLVEEILDFDKMKARKPGDWASLHRKFFGYFLKDFDKKALKSDEEMARNAVMRKLFLNPKKTKGFIQAIQASIEKDTLQKGITVWYETHPAYDPKIARQDPAADPKAKLFAAASQIARIFVGEEIKGEVAESEKLDSTLSMEDYFTRFKNWLVYTNSKEHYLYEPGFVIPGFFESGEKTRDQRTPFALSPILALRQAGFESTVRPFPELAKALVENGMESVEYLPPHPQHGQVSSPALVIVFTHPFESPSEEKFSQLAVAVLKENEHLPDLAPKGLEERKIVEFSEDRVRSFAFKKEDPLDEKIAKKKKLLDLAIEKQLIPRVDYTYFSQEGVERIAALLGRTPLEQKIIGRDLKIILEREMSRGDVKGNAFYRSPATLQAAKEIRKDFEKWMKRVTELHRFEASDLAIVKDVQQRLDIMSGKQGLLDLNHHAIYRPLVQILLAHRENDWVVSRQDNGQMAARLHQVAAILLKASPKIEEAASNFQNAEDRDIFLAELLQAILEALPLKPQRPFISTKMEIVKTALLDLTRRFVTPHLNLDRMPARFSLKDKARMDIDEKIRKAEASLRQMLEADVKERNLEKMEKMAKRLRDFGYFPPEERAPLIQLKSQEEFEQAVITLHDWLRQFFNRQAQRFVFYELLLKLRGLVESGRMPEAFELSGKLLRENRERENLLLQSFRKVLGKVLVSQALQKISEASSPKEQGAAFEETKFLLQLEGEDIAGLEETVLPLAQEFAIHILEQSEQDRKENHFDSAKSLLAEARALLRKFPEIHQGISAEGVKVQEAEKEAEQKAREASEREWPPYRKKAVEIKKNAESIYKAEWEENRLIRELVNAAADKQPISRKTLEKVESHLEHRRSGWSALFRAVNELVQFIHEHEEKSGGSRSELRVHHWVNFGGEGPFLAMDEKMAAQWLDVLHRRVPPGQKRLVIRDEIIFSYPGNRYPPLYFSYEFDAEREALRFLLYKDSGNLTPLGPQIVIPLGAKANRIPFYVHENHFGKWREAPMGSIPPTLFPLKNDKLNFRYISDSGSAIVHEILGKDLVWAMFRGPEAFDLNHFYYLGLDNVSEGGLGTRKAFAYPAFGGRLLLDLGAHYARNPNGDLQNRRLADFIILDAAAKRGKVKIFLSLLERGIFSPLVEWIRKAVTFLGIYLLDFFRGIRAHPMSWEKGKNEKIRIVGEFGAHTKEELYAKWEDTVHALSKVASPAEKAYFYTSEIKSLEGRKKTFHGEKRRWLAKEILRNFLAIKNFVVMEFKWNRVERFERLDKAGNFNIHLPLKKPTTRVRDGLPGFLGPLNKAVERERSEIRVKGGRSEVRGQKTAIRLLDQEGLIPVAVRYIDLFLRLAVEEKVTFDNQTGDREFRLDVPDEKNVYFASPGNPETLLLGVDYKIPGVNFQGNVQNDEFPVITEWDSDIQNISAVYVALDREETEYLKLEILRKRPHRDIEPFDTRPLIFDFELQSGLAITRRYLSELPARELVLRASLVKGPFVRSELRTTAPGDAEKMVGSKIQTHEELIRFLETRLEEVEKDARWLQPYLSKARGDESKAKEFQKQTHRRILEALNIVPRDLFVPSGIQREGFKDLILGIGHGQTLSQPTVVADMLALAGPNLKGKVLDVGSGSGYTTALLSHLADEVVGLERIPELAEGAQKLLGQLGIAKDKARILVADASQELPLEIPNDFDLILVSAEATFVPETLVKHLAPGGALVIPIYRRLTRHVKSEDGTEIQKFYAPGLYQFVEFVGANDKIQREAEHFYYLWSRFHHEAHPILLNVSEAYGLDENFWNQLSSTSEENQNAEIIKAMRHFLKGVEGPFRVEAVGESPQSGSASQPRSEVRSDLTSHRAGAAAFKETFQRIAGKSVERVLWNGRTIGHSREEGIAGKRRLTAEQILRIVRKQKEAGATGEGLLEKIDDLLIRFELAVEDSGIIDIEEISEDKALLGIAIEMAFSQTDPPVMDTQSLMSHAIREAIRAYFEAARSELRENIEIPRELQVKVEKIGRAMGNQILAGLRLPAETDSRIHPNEIAFLLDGLKKSGRSAEEVADWIRPVTEANVDKAFTTEISRFREEGRASRIISKLEDRFAEMDSSRIPGERLWDFFMEVSGLMAPDRPSEEELTRWERHLRDLIRQYSRIRAAGDFPAIDFASITKEQMDLAKSVVNAIKTRNEPMVIEHRISESELRRMADSSAVMEELLKVVRDMVSTNFNIAARVAVPKNFVNQVLLKFRTNEKDPYRVVVHGNQVVVVNKKQVDYLRFIDAEAAMTIAVDSSGIKGPVFDSAKYADKTDVRYDNPEDIPVAAKLFTAAVAAIALSKKDAESLVAFDQDRIRARSREALHHLFAVMQMLAIEAQSEALMAKAA